MRPRKSNLSIYLNKHVAEEEHGLKNGRKVEAKIKQKIEADKDMDDNNLHVQTLKQQNNNMRWKI
jgi:hypothetical protein